MRLQRLMIAFLLVCCAASGLSQRGINPKNLSPYFRQWIEEDVAYIIMQDERREFLKLHSDDEREHFIAQFWESRNPAPHSSTNSFKEEHYRRLAYVRATFGDERYDDGWRTDMGRIYITLGAPQQKAAYHQGMSTRPVEIWFYQSPSPALPTYFNLVFFKASESEPYTLYSPRFDGPTKVVTNDLHDDAQALRTIDKSMGAEATHAMVSLIPGEPIDFAHPQPTMESELLLDAVRNLPEQKLEKDRIARLTPSTQESVTSTLLGSALELQTVVLRDGTGLYTAHYLARNLDPDPALIGPVSGGQMGYRLSLTTRVTTLSGKAVYERRELMRGSVSPDAVKASREKKFAAEGRLPLVPGKYSVESILTNELTRNSARAVTQVVVTAIQSDSIAMSDLLVYHGRPEQALRGQLPFTVAGLRFAPVAGQMVERRPGEALPLVFQLWLPPQKVAGSTIAPSAKPEVIHVHYTLGSVAFSSGDRARVEEDQEVSVADADQAGNIVTGRTLDTTNLQQGTYRLVIRATKEGSAHSTSATMTVKIVASETPVGMWTAFSDERQHPAWQDDLLRGIAAEAQGYPVEASNCYRRALAAEPGAVDAQSHLDTLTKYAAHHLPGLNP